MKVAIDIDDYLYDSICNNPNTYTTYLQKLIREGTPLPKGHGKLVDVEDVKDNIKKWKGYLDEDMMARINFTMDNNIPIIIQADKEMKNNGR